MIILDELPFDRKGSLHLFLAQLFYTCEPLYHKAGTTLLFPVITDCAIILV